MKYDIFQKIANDIHIDKYPQETEEQYYYRVSYSALGFWMKTLVATNSVLEKELSVTVNKGFIHRKIASLIDTFILIYPQLHDYYMQDIDAVDALRNVLLRANEIAEISFITELFNVEPQIIKAGDVYLKTGVIKPEANGCSAGLSWKLSEPKGGMSCDIREHFCIDELEWDSVLDRYTTNAKWDHLNLDIGLELFDTKSKQVFSSCWQDALPQRDGITMGRKPIIFGGYDYYLIKTEKGKSYQYKIPDYAKDGNVQDVQRLLFAIKAKSQFKSICNIDRYDNYSIYHCWSHLPLAEDTILRYIGWPVGGLKNQKSEFLIDSELTPLVNNLLEDLGMYLEVNNYE